MEMGKKLIEELKETIQSSSNSGELCHKLVQKQSVLKELLLLRQVVNTDSILITLFLNDFSYESFASNLPYIVTLVMTFFKKEGLSLLGSLCSVIMTSLLNKQSPWTTLEMSNLKVVLSVVEEVGIAPHDQIDYYYTLMDTFAEPRDSGAIFSLFDYSDCPGLKNSSHIYEKHKAEVFSADLIKNLSVGTVIVPFVNWIADQQIDYDNYIIFDDLVIVLFRILYSSIDLSESSDYSIELVVESIHHILKALSSDITRYCYVFFSYLLTLCECLAANPESSFLKNETVEMLMIYSRNNSLPKIITLPMSVSLFNPVLAVESSVFIT